MKLSLVIVVLMLIIISYKGMADAGSWIPFKSHFYKNFSEAKTWDNAKKECEAHGGYLLEITSSQENKFIKDQMSAEPLWIGLRVNPERVGDPHKDKDKFWWLAKRELPVFLSWEEGEPNNFHNNEKCAVIKMNGLWNDYGCLRTTRFWCEKDTAESWIQYNDQLYKSFSDAKTWGNAKKECEVHGGYLLEITSSQENNFIKNHMSSGPHWIGLRQKGEFTSEGYLWVRKKAVTEFTAWARGEPSSSWEECVEISSNGWHDNNCDREFSFWCEKNRAESWIQYNGQLYKIFDVAESWDNAKKECEAHNGYLVEITSSQENNFIKDHTSSERHWIGLKRGEGNKFWWVKKEARPEFTDWLSDQPSSDSEKCVETRSNGWNDNKCDNRYRFWCEKDRAELKCTYPLSHGNQNPWWQLYQMGTPIRDDWATHETCQYYCSKDENCRSSSLHEVGYLNFRQCIKYNISIQDLKDRGDRELILSYGRTTYDRYCESTNKYPVSHNRSYPTLNFYRMGYMRDDSANPKTCWNYCNVDVNCRSVLHETNFSGASYCHKFSISVQELKNMGRYDEIHKRPDTVLYPKYITYDREWADLPGGRCTDEYPVSHDWERPADLYTIGSFRNDSATAKTCQDYCSRDANCRSVWYGVNKGDHQRDCTKLNISLQVLKYMEMDIWTVTDEDYDKYITYDRHCAELSNAKCTYPVVVHDHPILKYYKIDNLQNTVIATCQDWCNLDVRCKSVLYFSTLRLCIKFDVSVQELRDKGRNDTIYFGNIGQLQYDRYCECPQGHEPSSYLFGFCKPCSPGFFKASEGSEKCTKCENGEVSENKTSCE